MTTAPLFVSFEGIDGSGKSTQARLLAETLREQGRDVVLTREPGGSAGAEEIRRLLVEGAPTRWSPHTEMLLFAAARRDHLEKLIEPSLNAGKMVISDRFADSSRVYQGVARTGMADIVERLHTMVIGRDPDLTFVIDMDPEQALRRGLARRSGEDRFEDFGLEFQQKLRAGFRALVGLYPSRCHLIDGARDPETVAADIAAHFESASA